MAGAVLQKLLSVDMSRNVVRRGFDQVGGIVVEAGYVVGLNTPELLLSAYGFDQDVDTAYVDVVRFEVPTCAQVTIPADTVERPWPTYPFGFLRSQKDIIVPVWELSWTRFSVRAEVWRIHRDGSQECISWYGPSREFAISYLKQPLRQSSKKCLDSHTLTHRMF